MTATKKSFIIHLDALSVLDELDDKQAGRLFKTIREYHLRNAERSNQDDDAGSDLFIEDFVTRIAFAPFKAQFQRDEIKYDDFSKKQSENGSKGGRPKKDNANLETQKTQAFLEKPKKAYSVSDSVSDSVSVNKKEKYKKEVLEIFESYKCIVKHKELTEEMNKLCELAITNSSLEFVLTSIKNYNAMLKDPDFFFNYRWGLVDFLKKQKGKSEESYKRFNENGDLFMSFKQQKTNKKQNQLEPISNPYSKLVIHT